MNSNNMFIFLEISSLLLPPRSQFTRGMSRLRSCLLYSTRWISGTCSKSIRSTRKCARCAHRRLQKL